MAGRPRSRAAKTEWVKRTPEQIKAEQNSYREMVKGFMELLTEDYDAWQVVVNVCHHYGTSISENNLLLMMAQFAGITPEGQTPGPFADTPHIPSDVRGFGGWVKYGRSPAKGMGVKMWEPVIRNLTPEAAAAAKEKGEKGIRWDDKRNSWVKMSFKLGTRWDIAHTTIVDADKWAAAPEREAREGGAELAASIADSIFDEYGIDVTIPPSPTEPPRPRKRPTREDDAPTFVPPERVYDGPLFGGATGGTGGSTTPPAQPGPGREGPALVPSVPADGPARGTEGDGPGDGPTTRARVADFLRSSGYTGKGFDGLTRAAFRELTDAAIVRARAEIRGGPDALLNREARAKGIDDESLFVGPLTRAHKWASEDLIGWWAVNGRPTYAEYVATLLREHDTPTDRAA